MVGGRCSRRRFLGAAAALGGALWIGCGREEAGRAPRSDSDIVAALLAREQATLAAATRAPAGVREQDARHVARLARALAQLGGRPRAAPPAGDPAGLPARKQQAVFAYVDALPRLSDPELRVLVMQIAASEAGHLAELRIVAGEEPVPDAFAGYTAGTHG